MNYLEKLKEKCALEDNFMEVIYSIFEKLISFGYITKKQEKFLQKRLYNNIDVVVFGNESIVDYKTGYYDAIKKELYIKDITNIESIYLRVIYALTTSEISRDVYSIGYSVAAMSRSNYKIVHNDFGINRAITSNLVCRLLYTLPTSLELVPTYRTYENDFLGNAISADNDIYFLEGKLLSQLCYILNTTEESLYMNLFTNPRKYLDKFFRKYKLKNYNEFLKLFDETSRKYSNYNKLVFLNKTLNDNYLNIKKNALKPKIKGTLLKEQEKIKLSIAKTLDVLNDITNDDDTEQFENIEASLSGKIFEFEEIIKQNIISLQETIVSTLLNNESKYSHIDYTIKLKKLNSLLILQNEEIEEKIYNTISKNILNTFEVTSNNLIEKIKYSLVNEILSSEKYIKIYKDMDFNKLEGINISNNNSNLICVTVNKSFMQLVLVNDLNLNTKELKNNTKIIHYESMGYLLNNPSSASDISYIEKVFTKIKNKYSEFASVRIENMYIASIENNTFVIIPTKDNFCILNITKNEKELSIKKVRLSESYSVFASNYNSNMPVLYNKNEGKLNRLLSLFAFFS